MAAKGCQRKKESGLHSGKHLRKTTEWPLRTQKTEAARQKV